MPARPSRDLRDPAATASDLPMQPLASESARRGVRALVRKQHQVEELADVPIGARAARGRRGVRGADALTAR